MRLNLRVEENAFLDEEACRRIPEISQADLVVCIPSFNDAHTIGHAVRAVDAGLVKL